MNPVRPFAVALTFLTRLPIKVQDVKEADLGRCITCFPLVGLVLGFALAETGHLARGHLSLELIAVGLVSLLVGLTGGLHLDGLADVFDSLAGSRGDRERMLAIMRDSRIGSLGGAAMLLVLLGKVFATVQVLKGGSSWPLLGFPLAARGAVVPLIIFFPYARSEGLGKAFHENGRVAHFIVALTITAMVLGAVGVPALVATAAAFLVALALGVWIQPRLGGLTGDVYGAAIELSELAFLIIAGLEANKS